MTLGNRPALGFIVLLALAAVGLSSAAVVHAADADANAAFAGKWRGEMEGARGTLVMIMELTRGEDGAWSGTIKSSQYRDIVVNFESVHIDGDHLVAVAKMASFTQTVDGKLSGENKIRAKLRTRSEDGSKAEASITFQRVTGEAAGAPTPTPGSVVATFDSSNPISGTWTAPSSKEDKERALRLELGRNTKGDWAGTITDTGTNETSDLRDISLGENTLSFNFRPEGAPFLASFWGRYLPEEDQLQGSMSIGGRSQFLTFTRVGPKPGSTADEFAAVRTPKPRKHFTHFGVSGRASYWHPLYVLKERVRNINDITSSTTGVDGGVRWYVQDTIAFQARYYRGGLGFDANAKNLALFDPVDGPQGVGINPAITKDAFLAMRGYEFTINGYLGPSLFPKSHYNPYIIGAIGRTKWSLGRNGRGSEPITIYDEPLEGTDWHFGGGLGTEYALGEHVGLELEWLWMYTKTANTKVWTDDTLQWTNTHAFRFSLGLLYWF